MGRQQQRIDRVGIELVGIGQVGIGQVGTGRVDRQQADLDHKLVLLCSLVALGLEGREQEAMVDSLAVAATAEFAKPPVAVRLLWYQDFFSILLVKLGLNM